MGFAIHLLDLQPTKQQIEYLDAVAQNSHVTVRSGHGTGKTASNAIIILWWLYTRAHSKVPCTAPTENQLRDVLWSSIKEFHNRLPEPLRKKFEVTTDRVSNVENPLTWFAVARTARREKPEALQGFHGENLMFVADEASGIPEEIFTVVRAALTDARNKVIMTSNPTRTVGFFYNSHNSEKGPWVALRFNAEESPLVSEQSIKEYEKDYGKNSDVYRVRVLGEFPRQDDQSLIPREWIDAALEREVSYVRQLSGRKYDAAGVDVARYGENQTIFILVKGCNVLSVFTFEKQDTMKTAGKIVGLCNKLDAEDIKIDVIGVGGGVVDRLWELGHNVTPIDVSKPATDADLFANKRAEYWWHLRSMFETGNISLKPLRATTEPHILKRLVKQLLSIRYEISSSGKIQIWSKEKMRKESIPSPDIADALMLAFADYTPYLKEPPPKTWTQKWIEQTERKDVELDRDGYEQWARDFFNKDGYFDEETMNESEGVWGW